MSNHSLLQIGIYVILIVGFAFVGMYFIYLYVKPIFVRKQILQKGVLVEGCIIEGRREFRFRSDWHYYLKYRYEYQGTAFTQEKQVNENAFLAYPDGTRISLRCMPDDPTRATPVDFRIDYLNTNILRSN